ncbi:hypothetical protein J2W22_001085 [Sphingomonas kyeonggiensis]|uniref:hypothetical protein n=1 Tax=Sphingomonas kyeonggiensis TaxID=1268553 RepID=UPI00277EB258|nr:hypothetical protein [Sphingomonas kyeonggiensis]MDQ0249038.1 hypothetical protein [Sphingomonas kyeonggiensis]
MNALLPMLFMAATPCPGGERIMTWQGMAVRRRETPDGVDGAAISFCRGKHLVRRIVRPDALHWTGFKALDLDGDGRTELTSTYWSGGAHCCFTQVVFRANGKGVAVTRLSQRDHEKSSWRRLPGYPRPVMLLYDFSSAYAFTAFSGTVTMPYVVEIGPRGFRLAAPLMRAREPGWGPAALRHGPRAWAAFLRYTNGYETPLARVDAPAQRLTALHKLVRDDPSGSELRLAAETHIKLYCYYDARCDLPGLVHAIEKPRPGLLGGFPDLARTMQASNISKLRRAPTGWR